MSLCLNRPIRVHGFTLIEALLYLAVVSGAAVAFVSFGLAISNTRAKTAAVAEVQANGRFALEFMAQKVRMASDVNIGSSVFGSDPGQLSLVYIGLAQNPTVLDLNQDDGRLRVTEGVSASVFVTSTAVRVTRLVFTDLTGSSLRPSIRVELTVDYPADDQSSRASVDFTTAVNLRQ